MEATTTPQNGDDVGENVNSNENDAPSNAMTTPVASRALIQDFPGTSTTPEASASLLPTTPPSPNSSMMLREWAPDPQQLAQLQHLPNISSPMPPVAPAELIIQREGSTNSNATVDATATRTSNSQQYPVATIVTSLIPNLIRSVSEHVREDIRGMRTPCGVIADPISAARVILDAPATVTTASSDSNSVNNNDAVPIMPAAPSEVALPNSSRSDNNLNVADFEDANQQWTVVNDELVMLDYTQEGNLGANDYDSRSMGDLSRDELEYMQKYDRRNTKSSRIQRSVRGLKKVTRRILSRAVPASKKKGDRNKVGRGESTRRKQGDSRGQRRYEQENPSHHNSIGFGSNESNEYNDFGESVEFSISEALRVRRDTASDDGNESGDGGSLIEAPTSQQFSMFSHQAPSMTIDNNNNMSYEGDVSALTSQFQSEEFSVRTESHRSTYQSPTTNRSPSGSNNNIGQKKKSHRLQRWLRGSSGGRGSISDFSSSNPSTASSGSGASLQRKNRRKHPPSSPPKHSRDPRSTTKSLQLPPTRDHLRNDLLFNDGKPAALEPSFSGQPSMPPLREASRELSASTSRPSSFAAESPLHAPPLFTGSNGALHDFPRTSLDGSDFQRATSIAAHASFVGNADSFLSEAAILPASEYYIEDRLDEYDKYDDKNVKGTKFSKKADKKHMGPSIENMMERAGKIATSMRDEDIPLKSPPSPSKSTIKKGKSDGESVPLSMADSGDDVVHNDTMKLVLVGDSAVDKSGLGRLLRKTTKKSKRPITLAVDVQDWMPQDTELRFTIWDVVTSRKKDPYLPNFGAHPGTQSLFFSDRSLYLLVYDLGISNPETLRQSKKPNDFDSDDDDSDDDDEWNVAYNDFNREEANRKADRALEADIKERVLSWVDCIARHGTHSTILPIALLPSDMPMEEVARRLHIMKAEIVKHEKKLPSNIVRPEIVWGRDSNIVCVSLHDKILGDLERNILDIADASLRHRRPVPPGTVQIMNTCRKLKKDHKMILVDHLIANLPNKEEFSEEAVLKVLKFLATIGEVLYFGDYDPVLKDHVILCRKWLVGALECILRNDLQREVSDARDFLRWQTFYSDLQLPESHVTQTFTGNNSSCPILSHQDTQILWQSTNFMMEAVDQSSQRSENLTTMFDFLQHLLQHTGVFLPLEIDRLSSTDKIYFVPSLLPQASSRDVWTYKCSESWMVTLCHTWLFRNGAPVGLMEQVTVALLRDLYESCHASADTPIRHSDQPQSKHHLERSHTFPFAPSSMINFMECHDGDPIGQIKIHQINCWKNSLLIKIGRNFPQENELRESTIEIFVALTDRVSPHCVASDVMKSNDMQRLVVSGKGQVGLHGQKLWKGGYNLVLDSIKASVANCKDVERQILCPECLARREICNANTWSWDSVLAETDDTVRCMAGHKVDRHLICGTAPMISRVDDGAKTTNTDKKPIKDLLPSVVIVGLWDNDTKTIQNVGSGFIANKKHGLIVTASHVLFNMERGSGFGVPLNRLRDYRAIIGIIPDAEKNNTTAVFRYYAKILAHDVHNMDACILKITTRIENDVQNHSLVGEQSERHLENIQEESLSSLKITSRYEIEQAVRLVGFNQGGEGRLECGKHVNRTSCFAPGIILKQFRMDDESTSSDDSSTSEEGELKPREEIVVFCRTINGHSGGPCVNDDGKVIGILSRSDPADPHRCYLVPSSEIKILITKAKDRLNMGFR